MRAIFALVLLGCTHQVPIVRLSAPQRTSWCFTGTSRVRGRLRVSIGCFEEKDICAKALKTAQDYGSIAGVLSLTPCTEEHHADLAPSCRAQRSDVGR